MHSLGTQDSNFEPLFDEPVPERPSPPGNLRVFEIDGAGPAAYFNQLQDSNPEIRYSATKTLRDFDPALILPLLPRLTSAITNNDVVVRRFATGMVLKLKLGEKAYDIAPLLIQSLLDEDAYVRANSAAGLGSIGPAAVFAVPALLTGLSDKADLVRTYCARALGSIRGEPEKAIPKLTQSLKDSSPDVRIDAIQSLGKFGSDTRFQVNILASHLSKTTNIEEQQMSVWSVVAISQAIQDQDNVDALDSLRDARAILSAVKTVEFQSCLLSVERTIKYLELLQAKSRNTKDDTAKRQRLAFAETIPEELKDLNSMAINGHSISLSETKNATNLYYLGSESLLEGGLNWLTTKREKFLFWFEEKQLKRYEPPYSNSCAVIVAIDDYERKQDKSKRGPTGYRQLSGMVEHAQALALTLQGLGFKKENIQELYNQDATSDAIKSMLERFWQGGEFSSADRVFFYFGGHGDQTEKSAFLVTYDFIRRQPTLSSLLMRDVTGRYFENVTASHFLVALDSCHSGLAMPQLLSSDLDEDRLKAFRTLSVILGETEKPARNIIVSGTGNQKALWENGGIFTKALVGGLQGEADLNKDGVIQFDELALHVKNEVRAEARRTGVEQVPDQWKADRFGRGSVIFLRERGKK